MTASKKKLRFATPKGNLSTEDLWDLTLEQLDKLCVNLSEQLEKNETKSFLKTVNKDQGDKKLKHDIAMTILSKRVEEAEMAATRSARLQEKAKIERLIERKEEAELESMSIEDLKARAKELE